MYTSVNKLTVEEAYKEFNSLVDNISTKFMQLDLGEFWAVDTPTFNAKSTELAALFACMSQLCQRLNLPMPTHLHGLLFNIH